MPFAIAGTWIAVIAAMLSCMLDRTQADVLIHMDPRDSLTFLEPDLTNILDFGIQHAAIYFPTWSREDRKKIVPTGEGKKENAATHDFDVFCETSGADDLAFKLDKECGKNCPYDHDVIVSFGTLPGENFVEDGVLHYGCGVVKWPKECNDPKSQCDDSKVKAVKGDFVAGAVKSMNAEDWEVRMITQPVLTEKAMKDTLIAWAKQNHKNISLPK